MNMGSLRADLVFPPRLGGGVGAASPGADASDYELDEDTMIMDGASPHRRLVRRLYPQPPVIAHLLVLLWGACCWM